MLIQFSVSLKGGIEVYSYDTEKKSQILVNSQLISGFIAALQIFSESMGTKIQKIQMSNLMLYIRSYGDFTLRILTEENLNNNELDTIFNSLSQIITEKLKNHNGYTQLKGKSFEEEILQVLDPLVNDPLERSDLLQKVVTKRSSKIAIIGLSKVGKTSIKKKFFEQWSKEKIESIKPTIGIAISNHNIEFLLKRVTIIEFGGQTQFRKEHLKKQKVWKNIVSFIYVVDLQDQEAFQESKNYLSDIWNHLIRIGEKIPRLTIFMHKYDPNKRVSLDKTVIDFFNVFNDFLEIANFHLTTIEDNSSNIAVIKALYFSLPDIIITRLLEEEFLHNFETLYLPQFTDLMVLENSNEILKESRDILHKSAIIYGMSYGIRLQKSWLDYLTGKYMPKQRSLTSNSLNVLQNGQQLTIKIFQWINPVLPEEIIISLLEGFLEGILKTLHLKKPKRIRDKSFVTWNIDL